MVPAGGLVVFAILFGAAIYFRKRAANHKRLMLLTVLGMLSPSIARLPLPFIPALGSWWFFGIPDLIAIALLAGDSYINGKVNRVYLAGTAFLVVSGPVQMLIARTDMWLSFAGWLTAMW
jgi:asparagine N-glycosylation enzyme membrane subunit Stt3